MLLLETSRKSAINQPHSEFGTVCGRRSFMDVQRSKQYRFLQDEVDFLDSLRRQKNVDPSPDDEE